MKRFHVFLLSLLFSPVSVFAQTTATLPPPPSPSVPAITAHELRAHVSWLASDELEGRGTGTPAIERAAEYIAREFARYGLTPAGDNGTFFQSFPVITGARTQENMLALLQGGSKEAIEPLQFMPYTFSASGEFTGPIVFARYGIADPSGERDDYDGLQVAGAVVIVRAGYPDDTDPHGPIPMLSTARAKALAARERGAAALLIVHEDEHAVRDFTYDRSPSDAGLPVGKLHIDAARMIFDRVGLGAHRLDELGSATADEGNRSAVALVVHDPPMSDAAAADPGAAEAVTLHGSFMVELERKVTRNVIGAVEGYAPGSLVVGGHYDHLGWGGEGSLYRGTEPMIHNGADDNASGTASVLELAQHFATQRPKHTMLFMAFSGEEMGLLGSAHWVEHPTRPLGDVRAMFNLDMVGRLQDSTRRLNIQGIGTSPIWKDAVSRYNDEEKFNLGLIEDGQGSSDHSSFYTKNIPVLFFFTGLHTDYHRPSDDADKLTYDGQETVTRYIAEIVADADGRDEIPFVTVAKKENQRVSRFNVYVGTIPDYSANEKGFRITGASPNSPADKAGMKEGDIIVRFGETEVRNIYDYMTALSRHTPGEDVPVVVLRGDDRLTLTVSLVKK